MCALQWSRHEREILSSHGFSQNQLCLWKYPSMAKVAEMPGHTSRVLHLAQSPDGTAVCSAAADETLRFWKCFAEAAPQVKVRPPPMSHRRECRACGACALASLLWLAAKASLSDTTLLCRSMRQILAGLVMC